MYFLHVDGLTLENWTITDANLTNDNWLMVFDEIGDLTLTNVSIACLPLGEADKGININNATNIRGGVTLTGLLPPQDGGDPFQRRHGDREQRRYRVHPHARSRGIAEGSGRTAIRVHSKSRAGLRRTSLEPPQIAGSDMIDEQEECWRERGVEFVRLQAGL